MRELQNVTTSGRFKAAANSRGVVSHSMRAPSCPRWGIPAAPKISAAAPGRRDAPRLRRSRPPGGAPRARPRPPAEIGAAAADRSAGQGEQNVATGTGSPASPTPLVERAGPDKSGEAPLRRRPDEKPKRDQRQKGADNQRHSNQEIKPVFTRHSCPPFTTRSC
jgi:hypothetical protein